MTTGGTWPHDGAWCWYYPIYGGEHKFAGVVEGGPRWLGDKHGPKVYRVRLLRGGHVAAAASWCLQPRTEEEGSR